MERINDVLLAALNGADLGHGVYDADPPTLDDVARLRQTLRDSGLEIIEQEAAALDPERLARALRAIHGNVIPLPNQPTADEWAAIIADWYESNDPGHPGPHLHRFRGDSRTNSRTGGPSEADNRAQNG